MSNLNAKTGVIPGVILVEPRIFPDDRGYFTETYHARKYSEAGLLHAFVQDNLSFSSRNVMRGLHYQRRSPQGKLVYVVQGEVFDVAVDIRRGSPTFGQWEGYRLSDQNHHQLYVPEGCAHGFVVLSDQAVVMYKCTELYDPKDDCGLLWNDPDIGIEWPVSNPILSGKDAVLPRLRDLDKDMLPIYQE